MDVRAPARHHPVRTRRGAVAWGEDDPRPEGAEGQEPQGDLIQHRLAAGEEGCIEEIPDQEREDQADRRTHQDQERGYRDPAPMGGDSREEALQEAQGSGRAESVLRHGGPGGETRHRVGSNLARSYRRCPALWLPGSDGALQYRENNRAGAR